LAQGVSFSTGSLTRGKKPRIKKRAASDDAARKKYRYEISCHSAPGISSDIPSEVLNRIDEELGDVSGIMDEAVGLFLAQM